MFHQRLPISCGSSVSANCDRSMEPVFSEWRMTLRNFSWSPCDMTMVGGLSSWPQVCGSVFDLEEETHFIVDELSYCW